MLYDYIYMKFQKRQNYRKESRPAVALGLWLRQGRRDGIQRSTKKFGDDAAVLYCDCSGGYMTIYNYENSSNCTPQVSKFFYVSYNSSPNFQIPGPYQHLIF